MADEKMVSMSGFCGGWKASPTTEIPKELAEALNTSLGAQYEPYMVLATQVVRGLNYMVLCKVKLTTLRGNESLAAVVVNMFKEAQKEKADFEIVSVNTIARRLIGGFDLKVAVGKLPEKVATGFGEVFGTGFVGASYSPLAYLGEQLLTNKAKNHMILCEQKLATLQQNEHIVVVILHEVVTDEIVGDFTLLSVEKLI